MADQRVNINIGTSYSGEGMNAAMGAVNKLSQTAGKVAGAVGRLGGTFEQIGGSAGKAIGNVSNLLGALAMGGPIGLAMAGVTALISVWQSHNEKVKEAKKKAEELNKEKKKLADEGMQEVRKQLESQLQLFDQITARWNNLSKAVQNVKKSYDDLAVSFDNIDQAELGKSIQTDVGKATSEEDRQRRMAAGNIKMAKLKGQQGIAVATTQVENAQENLSGKNGATARRENAEWNLQRAQSNANRHLNVLSEFMSQNGAAFDFFKQIKELKESGDLLGAKELYDKFSPKGKATIDKAEQFYNNNQAAQKAVQGAQDRLKAALQEEEIANNKLLEATNNLAAARLNAETSVMKAEQQEKELIQSQEEQKALEQKKKKLEEEKKNLQQKIVARQKQNEADQKRLDKEIKEAKEQYAKALKKSQIASNAADAILNGGVWNPNNAPIGGRANPRRGASANNTDNQPWQDFAKPEGWDQRWAQSHPGQAAALGIEAGLKPKEQAELNRIREKLAGGQELSEAEKARHRELLARDPEHKRQKAQEEADKAAEQLAAKQAAKEQAQQQAYTDIGLIKDKLDKLGLK